MPMFKDKLFCSKWGAHVDDNLTIGQLINELIKTKKSIGRVFLRAMIIALIISMIIAWKFPEENYFFI